MNSASNSYFQEIKTIYFDFDGTLHDSLIIYKPSFIKAYNFLSENKKCKPRQWADEEIKQWLGFTSKEMWENFMNGLEEPSKNKASLIIGQEMTSQMLCGNAKLYKNSLHVLKELKTKGYKLIFLSNCNINYMELSIKTFNLDLYFDDFICAEMYGFKPKHEILNIIKKNYEFNQVIVGDRFHDIKAGIKNNIYTIFCTYGYGKETEGNSATICIRDIKDILSYLN